LRVYWMFVCMCVCYGLLDDYVYIYICVCVCVCIGVHVSVCYVDELVRGV
jgi:hypothetical protein